MIKSIDFTRTEQLNFLEKVKDNSKLSWEKISNESGVTRSLLFAYKNRTYRMSLKNFIKLCKFAGIDQNSYNLKFYQSAKLQIKTPRLTAYLAEFLGVLAGDGHMNAVTHEVSITGHKENDSKYINETVYGFFETLFGLTPKIRIQNNAIRCWVYSKRLTSFISDTFGVPIGKKKNKIRIPDSIIKDKKLFMPYIRGLFDTDGSVYTHHGKDVMLEISSASPDFRGDIAKCLTNMGFHPSNGVKNVRLYRQNEVHDFFKIIRPKNNKHLRRFELLKNQAAVVQTG